MKANQIRIRGCCCGIPFGCGSVLLLLIGASFLQYVRPEWLFAAAALITLTICALLSRDRWRKRTARDTSS